MTALGEYMVAGVVPDRSLFLPAPQVGAFFGLLALSMLFVREAAGYFDFAIGPYAMLAGLGASDIVLERSMKRVAE